VVLGPFCAILKVKERAYVDLSHGFVLLVWRRYVSS
jgi:hypothetical protein